MSASGGGGNSYSECFEGGSRGGRFIMTPLDDEVIASLRAADHVRISGPVFVARDAAHRRMVDLAVRGEPLPMDVSGQVIYYAGPTPAPPGFATGSVGPTTSSRMDAYTPTLIRLGVRGMIGKGPRSSEVRDCLVRFKAIYFAAVGGVGALLARHVRSARVVAYEDLGPEAIREFDLWEFPAVVANDIYGGDVFEIGRSAFFESSP